MLLELGARAARRARTPSRSSWCSSTARKPVLEWTGTDHTYGSRHYVDDGAARRLDPVGAGDGAVRHGRRPRPDDQARDRLHAVAHRPHLGLGPAAGAAGLSGRGFRRRRRPPAVSRRRHPRRRHHRPRLRRLAHQPRTRSTRSAPGACRRSATCSSTRCRRSRRACGVDYADYPDYADAADYQIRRSSRPRQPHLRASTDRQSP